MMAQISRTARGLDDCWRPIKLAIECAVRRRLSWICDAVTELEASAPEMVAQLQNQAVLNFITNEGRQLISKRSKMIHWDDSARQTGGVTVVYKHHLVTIHSAAACQARQEDFFLSMSEPCECDCRCDLLRVALVPLRHVQAWLSPYLPQCCADCRDLPEVIHDYIATDPTSTLAVRYRLYCRHCILPAMQQVRQLLEAHASVVETPPNKFLEARFPHDYCESEETSPNCVCNYAIAVLSTNGGIHIIRDH
eukprot:SAG31_NODE_6579_length_1964_cov_5.426273_2_plen_251_part_00